MYPQSTISESGSNNFHGSSSFILKLTPLTVQRNEYCLLCLHLFADTSYFSKQNILLSGAKNELQQIQKNLLQLQIKHKTVVVRCLYQAAVINCTTNANQLSFSYPLWHA